jgi:eukaryotic-like serine/threonine-protein kinase
VSGPTFDLLTQLQDALEPQYRLERELGRGGMGVVFQATDRALDRTVAIKVVHPELAAHESIARRFLAEARLIARLRHPNIVAVHTAGTVGGLLYYVMDEVPGTSLRERLSREGRLPVAEVGRLVADLAAALDAAGRAGVVHRDVKPENVLLDSASGRAMLADFGIARAVAASGLSQSSTGQGVAVGTPAYMSPEQAAGEEVDSRSDLYALGVVAYEMLAGQPPFDGPNRVIVSKHIAERPTPIARLRPDTPAPLADAVMKALEKVPAERWQTGEDFRAAVSGERRAPRQRSRVRRTLATAAVALAAVGATVSLARHTQEGPPPGVNPRHSMLVFPFDNLRDDRTVDWLREGSVSMLGLNLQQWNDLKVIDHERLHDLLERHNLKATDEIGLDMARRIAREAGVWTIVLGDYTRTGDSLHLVARVFDVASGERVDVAQVDDRDQEDVRPLFDQLAARLLDLSGAPGELRTGIAAATTASLEAYRAYLNGTELLNRWDLAAAERELRRATASDTTFGLAYYKLALTRGWLAGPKDSIADQAMVRAMAHSGNLPAHDRTVIRAYNAFLSMEYASSRALYQQLITRDTTDADAWYGLGEAWFHDGMGPSAPHWTQALKAFRRTLTLDPDYALAYDHVGAMLNEASKKDVYIALLPGDSFVMTHGADGRPVLDSVARTAAARRAREASVALARSWVASQPATVRASGAMVDAYLAAGNHAGALAEVARFRQMRPEHPELPFVEARIRFAAGEIDRAAATLRGALDTVTSKDFRPYEGTPTVLGDLAAAANVFAYQGDLTNAAKAIDLAAQVRREVYPQLNMGEGPTSEYWRRQAMSDLYAAVGAPAASMRRIWQSAAEAGRSAPPEKRKEIVYSGATAAVGLFTGPEGDQTALTELMAMTGETPVKEIRALMAISHQDSASARRALAEPDSLSKTPYRIYRRPLAAQAYFVLGDYRTALELLDSFEPEALASRGFDARWGIVGRVRLLRAEAHEKLGHRAEARQQYRAALAQWKSADPALLPYIKQAEQGLARLGEG